MSENTSKSIFEFHAYKAYLEHREARDSLYRRGFRSRLAETLGCQNAYVSQVFNSHANFGLEHALGAAKFLDLTPDETRYFLCLVEHARAGSVDLREHFAIEAQALRQKNLNISARVPDAEKLSPEARATYYSHWMFAAIHMLVTLKTRRKPKEIIEALRLPEDAIRSALEFLLREGLIFEKRGELHPGAVQIHLGKDAGQIRQHHTNWRLAAIESLASLNPEDVHYSAVSTLSRADAEKLKARFVDEIANYVRVVRDSPEETIMGFNLDFYLLFRE